MIRKKRNHRGTETLSKQEVRFQSVPLWLCVSVVALFSLRALAADDWAQWRGPAGTGISAETEWANEGRATLWQKNVGLGYSCVAVADGRLYTMGFHEDRGEDTITCVDAKTGEEVWSYSYFAKKWDKYHGGGTNTTPVVAGDRLYACNREAQFLCFDAETGDLHWKKELMKEYEITQPEWAFAASPLVVDDTIYVNVGRAIAFDRDGNMKWQSKNYGHAYSTPSAFELNGREALAIFAGDGLAIVDRKDGSEITVYPWKTQYDVNAATPIHIGNDRIFISSGYNRGCALIDLSSGTASSVWENKEMRNHMDTSVLIDGHLYGFDEGMLKCMDLDGNVRWEQRGLGKGALSAAGERLIIMSGRGELIIGEASPEGFNELSRERVIDSRGVFWTAPVIVDGLIYCRGSAGDLVCRDHRQ